TDSRITSIDESIMRPTSALLAPVRLATSAINPLLFTSPPPGSAPAPYAPDGPLVNAALACNHLAHEKGADATRFPDQPPSMHRLCASLRTRVRPLLRRARHVRPEPARGQR